MLCSICALRIDRKLFWGRIRRRPGRQCRRRGSVLCGRQIRRPLCAGCARGHPCEWDSRPYL